MKYGFVIICGVTMWLVYVIYCRVPRADYRIRSYYEPDFLARTLQTSDEPFVLGPLLNAQPSENILSYSLYGTAPKYYEHLEQNIARAKIDLPSWTTRVYLHDEVPEQWRDRLITAGAEVQLVNDKHIQPGNSAGAFWRFLTLTESVNCIILDADDSLTDYVITRARNMELGDFPVIMTQNKLHWPREHIQGKLIFKTKRFKCPVSRSDIMTYSHRTTYGADEVFLTTKIGASAIAQGSVQVTLPFWIPDFMRRKLRV